MMTSQLRRNTAHTTPVRPRTGGLRIGRALLCFVAAYLIVTVLAGATTLIYAAMNNTAAIRRAVLSPLRPGGAP